MKRNPITRHRLFLSALHELPSPSSEGRRSDSRGLISYGEMDRSRASQRGEQLQIAATVRDELVEIQIPSLRTQIQRENAVQGVYDVKEVLGCSMPWRVTLHGAVSPCFLGALCNCRDAVQQTGHEFRILLTEGVKEISDAVLWSLIEHFHVEYEK